MTINIDELSQREAEKLRICLYCGESLGGKSHPKCKICGILLHTKEVIKEAVKRAEKTKNFNPLNLTLSNDNTYCVVCEKKL